MEKLRVKLADGREIVVRKGVSNEAGWWYGVDDDGGRWLFTETDEVHGPKTYTRLVKVEVVEAGA